MGAQNRSGSERADLTFEAGLHGLGLAGIRRNTNDFFGPQDLTDGHGDRALGNFGEILEPSFTDLLLPTSLVKVDDEVRVFGLKVGGWIVEGEMPILTDPDEGNIDGRKSESLTGAMDDFRRVRLAVQQVKLTDPRFGDEPFLKESAKAGWVVCRQADIFIQMKELNLVPGETGSAGQYFEELKLRCPGSGDHASPTA